MRDACCVPVLRAQGVEAVVVEVQPHTSHTNEAWAGRLPRALAHLGAGWWSRALASRQQHLYTTVPARLRPGCPAVLLVNRARSTALAGCQALRLHAGFNMNWCAQAASWVAADAACTPLHALLFRAWKAGTPLACE